MRYYKRKSVTKYDEIIYRMSKKRNIKIRDCFSAYNNANAA